MEKHSSLSALGKINCLLGLLLATGISLPAQIEVVTGGSVGVGTSTPIGKVDIRQDSVFNDLNASALNLTTVSSPTSQMRLGYDLTVDGAYIQSVRNGVTVKPIFLNAQGGNVGVGTTAPLARLEVSGSGVRLGVTNGYFNFVSTQDHTAYKGVFLGYDSSGQIGLIGSASSGGPSALAWWVANSGGTYTEVVRVDPAGNMGVGTTTPSQKLEVAGSVRATSFISNSTTYADFVFEPGYRLPALSEVEANIHELGHLPGIPSEAEAREHGIDLAAMQVKLLQKIEELTLHQIAQEKEIAALKCQLREK